MSGKYKAMPAPKVDKVGRWYLYDPWRAKATPEEDRARRAYNNGYCMMVNAYRKFHKYGVIGELPKNPFRGDTILSDEEVWWDRGFAEADMDCEVGLILL